MFSRPALCPVRVLLRFSCSCSCSCSPSFFSFSVTTSLCASSHTQTYVHALYSITLRLWPCDCHSFGPIHCLSRRIAFHPTSESSVTLSPFASHCRLLRTPPPVCLFPDFRACPCLHLLALPLTSFFPGGTGSSGTGKFGSTCLIRHVEHPITLAKLLAERMNHAYIAGFVSTCCYEPMVPLHA